MRCVPQAGYLQISDFTFSSHLVHFIFRGMINVVYLEPIQKEKVTKIYICDR